MANTDDTRRARARRQRERQYQIDRITARYEEEYRAGRSPQLDEYLRQYPEYAAEIIEFTLYFHAHAAQLPEPDAVPAAAPSPAAQRALARIHEQAAPSAPIVTPITGLIQQGIASGFMPPQLANAVGLSPDLLAKLEAHAIAAATIPRTLVQRLATTLNVAPEAIAAYLSGATATQAGGAFYYAEKAPTQHQESFLDAVQSSTLSSERKQEWAEITRQETGNQ